MVGGDRSRDGKSSLIRSVLISGASFAGLSVAYWMIRLGYDVTIVEAAPELRRGGTPVDIRDRTVDIVREMEILDAIRAESLPPKTTEFRNEDDSMAASIPATDDGSDGFEIDRDVLLDILSEKIEGRADIRFGTRVTEIIQTDDDVFVRFSDSQEGRFSLVIGCDGNHSATRKMVFGGEERFSHFLGVYFSISIIEDRLIQPAMTQIFSVPGRTVMLNSYENKSDIVLCFHTESELDFEHRNTAEQRRIVMERFKGLGWKTPKLLEKVNKSDDFYFDRLCQIKMPSWSKGRVALVGDAAYCASPAAGMGGSLALIGAAALGKALERHGDDWAGAFHAYEQGLRPFVEEVQAQAVRFGVGMLVPETEGAILERNERLG